MKRRAATDPRLTRVAFAAALLTLASASQVLALYEAPASYYSGVTTQTGDALKTKLQAIMTSGRALPSFDTVRDYLPFIDANPTNANQMFLVYSREVVANPNGAATIGFHGSYASREHTWPDSRLSDSLDAEPFFLRASDTGSGSANGDRANYYYGGATLTGTPRVINPTATLADRRFFAGDADKGDVARGMLYGATRYASPGSSFGLSLNNTATPNPAEDEKMGDLDTLLHWHYLDTPDLFERRRNDVIYSGDDAATTGDDSAFVGTGNRNAYIDHPEYVWSVYVDQQNDTKLTLAGGTTSADGGSAVTVNLGRVLKNAAVPAATTVTLNKAGIDGTYYEVTATGAATSDVTGRFNAFAMDAAGSRMLTVGLNTTTGAAGLKTGTVTVDNLDVTTQGGAGAGANDGNDVATINLSVLDASNSSFSNASDSNALKLNFGTIGQNASAGTMAFSIFDYASPLGATLTAMLDLDGGIVASGDASKFATMLSSFMNLAADGVGKSYLASFDTSTLGTFTAMYVLNFSDENLPGTVSTTSLTLTLTGTVVAVPEPTAFAMVILGVAPMVRRRRRAVC